MDSFSWSYTTPLGNQPGNALPVFVSLIFFIDFFIESWYKKFEKT